VCVSVHSFIQSTTIKANEIRNAIAAVAVGVAVGVSRGSGRGRQTVAASKSEKRDHFSYANRNSKSAHQSQIQTAKE